MQHLLANSCVKHMHVGVGLYARRDCLALVFKVPPTTSRVPSLAQKIALARWMRHLIGKNSNFSSISWQAAGKQKISCTQPYHLDTSRELSHVKQKLYSLTDRKTFYERQTVKRKNRLKYEKTLLICTQFINR